ERERQHCRANGVVVHGQPIGQGDLEELAGHRGVDCDEPVEHWAQVERSVGNHRWKVTVVADSVTTDTGSKTESDDRQAQAEPERPPFGRPCSKRASRERQQTRGPSLRYSDENALRAP